MHRKVITICIVVVIAIFSPLPGLCGPNGDVAGIGEQAKEESAHVPADSQQKLSWKEEFERLCAQTGIAATLPDQQIRDLIKDSDALLEKLESLKDRQVRVFVFRLKKCRMFFEYSLELNETG